MRKMTLEEINSMITKKGREVDYSVNIFRSKTINEGWGLRRNRPRDPDEIKALNYLSRKTLQDAFRSGASPMIRKGGCCSLLNLEQANREILDSHAIHFARPLCIQYNQNAPRWYF